MKEMIYKGVYNDVFLFNDEVRMISATVDFVECMYEAFPGSTMLQGGNVFYTAIYLN